MQRRRDQGRADAALLDNDLSSRIVEHAHGCNAFVALMRVHARQQPIVSWAPGRISAASLHLYALESQEGLSLIKKGQLTARTPFLKVESVTSL